MRVALGPDGDEGGLVRAHSVARQLLGIPAPEAEVALRAVGTVAATSLPDGNGQLAEPCRSALLQAAVMQIQWSFLG